MSDVMANPPTEDQLQEEYYRALDDEATAEEVMARELLK